MDVAVDQAGKEQSAVAIQRIRTVHIRPHRSDSPILDEHVRSFGGTGIGVENPDVFDEHATDLNESSRESEPFSEDPHLAWSRAFFRQDVHFRRFAAILEPSR
ncbi:hypothetical protein ACWEOE_12530 [Amycolatopsis sp. NPDC004368]